MDLRPFENTRFNQCLAFSSQGTEQKKNRLPRFHLVYIRVHDRNFPFSNLPLDHLFWRFCPLFAGGIKHRLRSRIRVASETSLDRQGNSST